MKSKNISISFIRLAVGVLLLLLVITFTGCIFFAGSDTGIAVPNLTVKGAPSDITALSLRVTGPGMSPVESYYSSVPSSIEIEVPAGVDRQFELIAHVGPSSLSAAVSFKGTATVDLAAGETTEIVLTMGLNETKLVIPDYRNNRLIQIDNISGAGWTALIGTDIGWTLSDFEPYDVDFDSQGRIYIANNFASTGFRRVIRVDDISGSNFFAFSDKASSIVALTVDRQNDYLYYSSSNQLWRVNLDGTADVSRIINVGVDQIQTIRGMAVGEDGMLYIAGNNNLGLNRIFLYDPFAQNVTTIYPTNINTAWDVLVKTPYIFITNRNGAGGYKIIQLDTDLGFIAAYGNQSPAADDIPGNYYGPKRFLAILNKKISILDEASINDVGFQGDRLVSIGDIAGTAWETYGQTGTGTGRFEFYWAC
ncbi:MAG TPA: hypothetical protein ENI06_08400 [Spirochaetales bacterium]|nr:hypothetical protein [Spirochaetales bacterium]